MKGRGQQRSDAPLRISDVAVKQDCHMLNEKRYLRICDMNTFEARTRFTFVFRSVVILEVAEHEFSSV